MLINLNNNIDNFSYELKKKISITDFSTLDTRIIIPKGLEHTQNSRDKLLNKYFNIYDNQLSLDHIGYLNDSNVIKYDFVINMYKYLNKISYSDRNDSTANKKDRNLNIFIEENLSYKYLKYKTKYFKLNKYITQYI